MFLGLIEYFFILIPIYAKYIDIYCWLHFWKQITSFIKFGMIKFYDQRVCRKRCKNGIFISLNFSI